MERLSGSADVETEKLGEPVTKYLSTAIHTAPCVICGNGGEFGDEAVVKVEDASAGDVVDDHHDVEGDPLDFNCVVNEGTKGSKQGGLTQATGVYSGNVDGKHVSQSSQKKVSSSSSSLSKTWTEDEKCAFQWFIKWFRLGHTFFSKGKGNRIYNHGWDGDSGKDLFPFCGSCKSQLFELVQFKRKIEELEKKITSGVDDLKVKANLSENKFGRRNIYEQDDRYKRARKHIVADFGSRYPNRAYERKFTDKGQRRKSSRKRAEETIYGSIEDDTFSSPSTPVAQESTFDRGNTDSFSLLDFEMKPDPTLHSGGFCNEVDKEDAQGEAVEENDITDEGNDSRRSKRQRKSRFSVKELDLESEDPSPEFTVIKDKNDVVFNDPDNIYWDADRDPLSQSPAQSKQVNKKRRKITIIADESDLETEFILDSSHLQESSPKKQTHKNKKTSKKSDSDFKPKPQRKQLGRPKKPEDEDWVVDGDVNLADDLGSGSSDEDGDDGDTHIDYEDRAKKTTNPDSNTVNYKNLVFQRIDSFGSLNDNMLSCLDCGAEVKLKRIRAHYLTKHSDKYACKKCDYRGITRVRLRDHVASVHNGAPSYAKRKLQRPCPICEKPCYSSGLIRHMWSHKSLDERKEAIASGKETVPYNVQKRHQCDECGRHFTSPSELNSHQETVHGAGGKERKMELCPECGGTFLSLENHRKHKHGIGAKLFTCTEEDCGKVFKGLSILTKHKDAVHRKIRPYQCSLCSRCFSKEAYLKKHMDSHLGKRDWKCGYCHLAFTQKAHLSRHEGIYHSEGSQPRRKPYMRGATTLKDGLKKSELIKEGKYLPPSALATWAAGREPTSHFPVGMDVELDTNTGALSFTSSQNNM